jgi:hypothetical protein
VGIGIDGDVQRLFVDYGFRVTNVMDVRHLVAHALRKAGDRVDCGPSQLARDRHDGLEATNRIAQVLVSLRHVFLYNKAVCMCVASTIHLQSA